MGTEPGPQARKSPNCTLEEVSEYLKLSERTVQNYQNSGKLTTVYFGKRRFFRWSEVEKLAKTGVPRG